jgi:carboxyl-terminal processing protease
VVSAWRLLLAATLALSLLLGSARAVEAPFTRDLALRTFDALVDLFRREYWDPRYTDWDAWAAEHRDAVLAAEGRDDFDRAMRRMVRALGDEHSSWTGLDHHDAARSGEGIGAPSLPEAPPWLGVQIAFVAGRGIVVERVYPGTPAASAGLQRGDVIVAVDGAPLDARGGRNEAQGLLREALERGRVRLLVERRRSVLELDVEAAPVALAAVSPLPYGVPLDATTGYLSIPSFNAPGIGRLVHERLRELADAGAVGLVLDLRGNHGGRLVELALALGSFVEGDLSEAVARGRVAWRVTYALEGGAGVARLVAVDGSTMAEERVDEPFRWRGGVVAIVGADNASAGEIAALALQDHGAALVVGEATSGNVEAVRGFRLPDGSRVMVAVANMRGARGLSYDDGVRPDVTARTTVADLARGRDPAVAEARRLLGRLPFTPEGRF